MALQDSQEDTKVERRLLQMKHLINQLLFERNYEDSYKNYNIISVRLVYLIKNSIFRITNLPQHKKELDQIMRMVQTLLMSTQFEKYGHVFPKLGFLIKKYHFQNQRQNPPNQETLLNRVNMNEQSELYKKVSSNQISTNQLKLLKTNGINSFFSELNNNQILLQNPQCLCCSQIFMKNLWIHNANPIIPTFAEISSKNQINKSNLVGYLTGLCNSGGGVLIIGAEKSASCLKATGIRFKDYNQICQYETQIRLSIQALKPKCNFLIERVLVHTSFLEQINPRNSSEQYMRLCFRVLVFPQQINKITYAEIIQKGKTTIYEVYSLNQELKPTKINQANQVKNSVLYDFIYKKYRERKLIKNSHQNINCLRPHCNYSKIFTVHAQLGLIQERIEGKQDENQQQVLNQACGQDKINLKYPHASMVVVSSKENDRFNKTFCDVLTEKKKAFKIQKPYQESFKQNVRSIWVMSHEMSCIDLRKILKNLESKSVVPQKTIKLMPIHRVLQIKAQKLTKYNEKIFQKKFKQKFTQMYKIQSCQVEIEEMLHLHFNDYSQSIYAYLIFEQMQIFTYFIKEGGTYVKK